MNATVSKQIFATAMKVEATAGLPSMTVSTAALDRDMDRVIPEGADFEAFERNPVLCWAHSRDGLPIGSVTHLSADSSGIRMIWKWLENDPMADRVRNAYDQGIVRAASIGFLSKNSTRNGFGGQDHTEWELLEISLVPVPSNPTAVRTLKSLGLWGSAESRLDDTIDWAKINQEPEINWGTINRSGSNNVQVDVTTQEVELVTQALMPVFRAHLREELRRQVRSVTEDVLLHMSGRLD